MAALASDRVQPLSQMVLWDPILNGHAWIAELEGRSRPIVPVPTLEGKTELGRQTVTDAFTAQLAEIRAPALHGRARRTLLLWTEASSTRDVVSGNGDEGFEVAILPQPSPWIEDVALGSGQIPVEAVTRIVDWMSA